MRNVWLAAVVTLVTACAGGGAPDNATVQVSNRRAEQASFSWRSAGLFGNTMFPDTGTDAIAGCAIYVRSFGSGHQEATVSLGEESLELVMDPKPTDELERYVVIDADGSITEVDAAAMPAEPCSP
jgi:hypothetical protein